ncbi:MAG: OmpA family protein [Treponema sp.]|jgi:outer membrane protein OmpA-like peptidoglycan-associated protein/flagellar hook assembly protein FlgD|nr:OmpA family protein [Treponema sp.]
MSQKKMFFGGALSALLAFVLFFPPRIAASPDVGADVVTDLYSPALAGSGSFVTAQGGAPAGAINPAAGGDAQRIVFDAGFLLLPTFGGPAGCGGTFNLGALFPTKYAVLGGSLHFLHSPFTESFPVDTTFGANFTIAKELYPRLNIGVGFNIGFGSDWEKFGTVSADLGFRYNAGTMGTFQNFTVAFAMKNLGKSWTPTPFTPTLGVSTDFIYLKGNGNTADPLRLTGFLDLGVPGFKNFVPKIGAALVLAEVISVSASWGLNVKELAGGISPSLPSLGVALNLALKSGGKRLVGGRLPSDGDVTTSIALKSLYGGITATGAGATWFAGVSDTSPPRIVVDYPETQWISPNNDGKADALEFPIRIQDQRFVVEWTFEIRNGDGEVVRTYRNKELRPETRGVGNVFVRLVSVKAAVDIPPTLRWDGVDNGVDNGVVPDGSYFFTVSAKDDNGNEAVSPLYEVVVDNTPPEIHIAELSESLRTFSPDGDGNKDTIVIEQSGSWEDLWEGGIYNAAGEKVRTFNFIRSEPESLVWDGADDEGRIVADGVYRYQITATDKAFNTGGSSLENIIISTIQPRVSLTIGDAYFSPNGDGVKDTMPFTLTVPVKEGVTGWAIRIKNAQSVVQRTISGSGGLPPARLDFDGKDDNGVVMPEGVYSGELSVRYRNGYDSTSISPSFTLDVTPPSAAIRADYTAFSPNNDGIQDEMLFLQEGSSETVWLGEVRRAGGAARERAVRTVRFNGNPPARFIWDGLTDAGAIAEDGEYTYQLGATDQAGNTGRSNVIGFSLSTADTPVLLSTDLRAFSPNGDTVRDTIALIPQLQLTQGIASWQAAILDSNNTVVRTFEGRNAVPASIPWNGRTAGNTIAPDGVYTARIEVWYAMGNQPSAISRPFTLDTVSPKATLNAPFTLFSPNGDGLKDSLPIYVETEGDDTWEAVITDSKGTAIRSWTWNGAAPELSWDGADQAGNPAPDGTYRFTLSSTDEAGNSFNKSIDNLVMDARIPRVFLTASATGIAPRDDQPTLIRLGPVVSLKEGIESWKLELQDESGKTVRTFPEGGGGTGVPPETINWNGRDDLGLVKEGKHTPVLTMIYAKGDVVTALAAPIMVDITGPVLGFASRPDYFSPDNDGVDDELIMNLAARDISPIGSWSLEIREPQPPYQSFYRIEGRGTPAERILWDGRSSKGELVQSATDYPFTFTAEDIWGNSSSLEGKIGVDVLVIRDGDKLRIQVPSIVFRANEADFNSLSRDVVDNNNRILRRIAEILNKFRDYKVQVEGHANPTQPAGAARDREESAELQPLSERRARATVDFLVGFGVNRNRLSAIGMGGSRPVIRFEDRDNWWKNRRVEFILIK